MHGVKLIFSGFIDGGDRQVLMDQLRTQQILINLIQNSIKFSKPGDSVIISMDYFLVSDIQNEIGVNIRVTDQGIGISKEDQDDLFKMFFKTKDEKSRKMNSGSHGIGLSVCKSIAKNLKGDLTLN